MFEVKDITGNISVDENLAYEDFIRIPEVPMQRNTEERIKSAKHLRKLRAEHGIVHLVKLTKRNDIKGTIYDKGMVFRVDSNTRAMTWDTGRSDFIPKKLIAITYEYETLDQIKECYNCFDSSEATERNQQKLYGILTGFYNYQPKSKRLTQGVVLAGLNKACHFMHPTRWNQTTIKSDQLEGMLGPWIADKTLQTLDELIKETETKDKTWCQPFIAAALMSLQHYERSEKIKNAWRLIINQRANFMSDEMDGVSHIIYEWMNAKFFKDKSICKDTKWENMNRTVSYVLYWLDKYMNDDDPTTKVGKGWELVAKEYKDRQDILNATFNIGV